MVRPCLRTAGLSGAAQQTKMDTHMPPKRELGNSQSRSGFDTRHFTPSSPGSNATSIFQLQELRLKVTKWWSGSSSNQQQSPGTKEGERGQMGRREDQVFWSSFPLGSSHPGSSAVTQSPNIYHTSTAGWYWEKANKSKSLSLPSKSLWLGGHVSKCGSIRAAYPALLFSSQTHSRTVLFCFLTVECVHTSASDI